MLCNLTSLAPFGPSVPSCSPFWPPSVPCHRPPSFFILSFFGSFLPFHLLFFNIGDMLSPNPWLILGVAPPDPRFVFFLIAVRSVHSSSYVLYLCSYLTKVRTYSSSCPLHLVAALQPYGLVAAARSATSCCSFTSSTGISEGDPVGRS